MMNKRLSKSAMTLHHASSLASPLIQDPFSVSAAESVSLTRVSLAIA